jgi:hypothetical protein
MANRKYFYNDFSGKKTEYILEKGLTLSQKASFVMEVAGMVVSGEVGYAYLLKETIFYYCLIKYYTNIELFENESDFSLDMIDRFIRENKENVIDVIRESIGENDFAELQKACDEAIEYRKLHYNDLKDEISDLLQVVREFVVKPDRMNELLEALTNAANSFANREDIDMESLNKLIDVIPIMKDMESKDVAKAIVEDFHNNTDSQNKPENKPRNNRGRKPNGNTKNIASNIEVVK